VTSLAFIATLFLAAAGGAVPAPEPPAPPQAAPAAAPAPKSEILGIWKGTSTCTKVEVTQFCNDETVVYNFVDVPEQPATVSLKAARVVDDVVQPMYMLYFTYQPDSHRWTSEFSRPSFRGVWAFAVNGDEMTGTATLIPKGTVVRNVVAKRTSKEQVAGR
jgi:hypothetical protein